MKKIIEKRLYDTEKSEEIFSFVRKVKGEDILWWPGHCWVERHDITIYKTKNDTYFECDINADTITIIPEEQAMKTIEKLDPDRYIELFGEVEEG